MILVCGEALFDVFVEPDIAGSDEDATNRDATINLRAVAGGSPFNVAIGLARLGCQVALSTEVGLDAMGQKVARLLSKEGVDLRLVKQTERSTPLALVETDEQGVPNYCFVGLRDVQFQPDAALIKELPEPVSMLHIGSYGLVSPESAEALYELVVQYSDRSLISLDPNIRLQIEPDVAVWRSAIERFRSHAQLIKVSTEDLMAIYGADVDVDAIARQWLSDRCHLVILTRGEDGASFFSRQHERVDVPTRQVQVVDTVGAGDSFQAATLGWLTKKGFTAETGLNGLTQDQLSELGSFAAHIASLVCERKGPDFPLLSELADDLRTQF